eukprot:COSAG05_NODE_2662_length_2791_cov_4.086181_3_plen_76_part_00
MYERSDVRIMYAGTASISQPQCWLFNVDYMISYVCVGIEAMKQHKASKPSEAGEAAGHETRHQEMSFNGGEYKPT